ncbi:FeS cluster assembly protein sufA [Candidatus Blochmanniella vafra str. BVAF]|uniref:FeS cluster assembly protein sufA n=1 Tax=Blochmanniella vafra (strain BVAF) TaxID=859654 RepID=E8Q661_BLOVB|nr:iron-sulfur cluster assembly accessory protein [Candidatus Blochmannia vafer]ADV33755.1 FeS cluster assembly protein sufA [Candidatus Blochmannia vafer str. BVAF]
MQNTIVHSNTFLKSNKNIPWKGVTLTDSAAQHILQLINRESKILGLKITIKKSGCAGLTYQLSKVFYPEQNTVVYEHNRAKLFVPINIMPIIDGTELDYIQDGLNYSFKFNNPKAQFHCGCGESFRIYK